MESSARPLKDFAEAARTLDATEFEAREGAGFLLYTPTGDMNQAGGDFAETMQAEEAGLQMPSSPAFFDVYPIVKRNPDKGHILVGRDATSDVVIIHPSISSVHAVFAHEDDGVFRIYDGDSRNGTYVNGLDAPKLSEKLAGLPLQPMARIRLGAFEATFLDSSRLHAMAKSLK